MTYTLSPGSSLPKPKANKFRKEKENKFKWYLIMAITVVFIVLAVTVIALTIYLTSESDTTGTKDSQYYNLEEETETNVTLVTTSTINDVSALSPRTSQSSTNSVSTISSTSHSSSSAPKAPTSEKHSTSSKQSTSMQKTSTQIHTTIQQTASPTSSTQQWTVVDKTPLSTDPSSTQITSSQKQTTNETRSSPSTTQSILSTTNFAITSEVSEDSTFQSSSLSSNTSKQPTSEYQSTTESTRTTEATTTTPNIGPSVKLYGEKISSTSPFTLTCEVMNVPGWKDLKIHRHYDESQTGIVAEMKAGEIVPTVTVFDNSMTFSATHNTDKITIMLMAHTFECKHAGKYSCSVSSASTIFVVETEIQIISDPPEINFPSGIVEDKTMSLECIVEFVGTSGDLKWTFSPPGVSDTFYELSTVPDFKNTSNSCTTKLESKLTFTPGMYDNGSNFRCEVVNAEGYNGTTVLQTTIPFYVLDTSICTNRLFEILNHPYQPCGKIVYCSENGPTVYKITCPVYGQCYDALTTQCISNENMYA